MIVLLRLRLRDLAAQRQDEVFDEVFECNLLFSDVWVYLRSKLDYEGDEAWEVKFV